MSRLLTVPATRPESWTPRQNGALLSGWLRARCALVSVGCGSGGVVADEPGGSTPGGPESFGATSVFAAGGGAVPCCAKAPAEAVTRSAASTALRRVSRMSPLRSLARREVVLTLRALRHLRVPARLVAGSPAGREKALVLGLPRRSVRLALAALDRLH